MKCLIYEPKINYDILNTAIDKCQNLNYLIMNQHTAYSMWRDIVFNKELQENWNKGGASYSEYHGIPIAICEQLINGEVDLI